MAAILLTSGAVLLLATSVYFVYDLLTFRQSTVRQMSTLGTIIATNSTAALAFESEADAIEILQALNADQHIVAACLYDKDNRIFATYSAAALHQNFPETVGIDGYRFEGSFLVGVQPVVHDNSRLGTLYLKSDIIAFYNRLKLYGFLTALLIVLSLILAYFLSKRFQAIISRPILALADTAGKISMEHDYSVRAVKMGEDELGLLTDAFNSMVTTIQEQNLSLKENHEKLDNIVQSMADAYISMCSNWRITFANNKALSLMGKTKEEVIGKTFNEIHPVRIIGFFESQYGEVMERRKPLSFESHSREEDLWHEVRVYPYENGIAVFITDITKHKKAEEQGRLFNHKLEQTVTERTNELEIVNRELEAFSYSISHDLRAPLRSIHGYMNILMEDYGSRFDRETSKLAYKVINNAKRMSLLIDDLLAFSKLGRKELIKTRMSMNRIVVNVWEELKKMEEGRRIDFILKELPEANVDSVTIRQVWVNLISNALKYSSKKENSVIEIGSYTKGNEVIYYVKDNGAGFDMKYYDKLFGVFQRLHADTDFEGTGVGLAIVQRIISKHGGRIWAEAKPNEGACFSFSLIQGSI